MAKAFSFPTHEMFDRVRKIGTYPGDYMEDYVRERTAQAKYPAAMLAELFAAGEITREQYERLRRENR